MRAGATVPRERVLETFWPEADPQRARQSVKTATWSIRRALRGAACDPDDHLLIGKRGLQ
jgi:DNA-binding SARP family transcriptional activator